MNEETDTIRILTSAETAKLFASERMNPSLPPTPETDAAWEKPTTHAELPRELWHLRELSRKLERERDEARREAESAWDCKWPKPRWSWLR